MIVLGIDPGSRRIGYGAIQKDTGGLRLIEAGLLPITAASHNDALAEGRHSLMEILKKTTPNIVAFEKLFFAKNRRTALAVAEMRGVLIATAEESGSVLREYAPNEVKLAVTGYGLADKRAVEKMVKLILKAPNLTAIDDAMDALAIALTALQREPFSSERV
jgi:crossover junction endodeoxyribonuclease RuvC